MILSMFTVLSVISASAVSIQVFARKWVRAEQVTGDYFSFTDLYQNFIICRGNPHFDETNYNIDDTANVYNRTETITLTNHNEVRLDRWDNGNGKLNYYWADNAENAGNGKIYLSTNGDNINFNTDGVKWYAYTWETFTVDEVAATSPTYQNGAYEYGYGEHYAAGNRNFLAIEGTTDGHQNVRQIAMAEVKIPYFEYEYINYLDTIRLVKCNSDDAEITVPDEIPSRFYPTEAPTGKTCSIIGDNAFKDRTSLVNVTIGNNVNKLSGTDSQDGAFYGCTALKTVTVGSGLTHVGSGCFEGCTSMTDFTTTSVKSIYTIDGVKDIAKENEDFTVHCYHDSDFDRELWNWDYADFDYLDENPNVHSYYVHFWNWGSFDYDHTVVAVIDCSVCRKTITGAGAEIVEIVDTPATCTTAGSGHYKAVVNYDGATFENDDHKSHTFTIPVDEDAHDWDMDDAAVSWTWTPAGGEDPGLRSITAKMTAHCKNCTVTQDVNGVVEANGWDEPGCITAGIAHYIATAEFNGKTFTGTKDYTLPAYGHHMTYHPAMEAAAAERGNTAYYSCDRCGKYFSDSNGEHEIAENSWVTPPLNMIGDGKVFHVGDPLVIPAETYLLVYGESTEMFVTNLTETNTTVEFSDEQSGSLMRSGKTLTKNIYNDEYPFAYAFTGLYMAKLENDLFVDEYYRVVPLYYNRETYPTWSAWEIGDTTATATISGFNSLQNGPYDPEPVAYTQTLEAAVESEFVPGDCITPAETIYCAKVSVYNYIATDYKVVPGELDPNHHDLDYYPAQEPTLSADGHTEYWRCIWCHKLFSDENGLHETTAEETFLPKTAVAQIGNFNYYSSLKTAVVHFNTDLSHHDAIYLLKDTDFEYDRELCQTYPSFKVKKNGHTINATADPCYSLTESAEDANGITTYAVTHKWIPANISLYRTLGGSEGSYTVNIHYLCTVCGEDDEMNSFPAEKHAATAPTVSSEGNIEYYTAVIGGNMNYYVLAENPAHENELMAVDAASVFIPKLMAAALAGHSISLDGDIAVNFYVELSDAFASSADTYMLFSVPGTSKEYQTQKVYLNQAEHKGKYYVFKCRVAAKDMDTQISATLFNNSDFCAFNPYSVMDYADYLLAYTGDNEEYIKAKPLVEAMVAYGENAKYYFDKTDEKPADIEVTIPEKNFVVNSLPEGVTFEGTTLSLKSQTSLSLYFVSEQELTLSMDGKTEGEDYEVAYKGNEYVIRIRNIAAKELNDNFTVTVTSNGQSRTVSYSPMTYCYKAQSSTNAKLVNTVKALYNYYLAAHEYF